MKLPSFPRPSSYIPLVGFMLLQIVDFVFWMHTGFNVNLLKEPLFLAGSLIVLLSLLDFRNTFNPIVKSNRPITKEQMIGFHTLIGGTFILVLNFTAVLEKPRLLFPLALMLGPIILLLLYLKIVVVIRKMRGDQD